jgi:hypothetical protein
MNQKSPKKGKAITSVEQIMIKGNKTLIGKTNYEYKGNKILALVEQVIITGEQKLSLWNESRLKRGTI